MAKPWGGGSTRSSETEGLFQAVRAVGARRAPHTHRRRWGGEGKACNAINPFPFAVGPLCPPLTFVSLEIAMRPDVEAMKADIEQSVALLRRRL